MANHNRKLGWRLPEIYFNSKENPNGRIFLFEKIISQNVENRKLIKIQWVTFPFLLQKLG